MRRTRRTVSRSTLVALLGAVLHGCAFFVPAVAGADGIAVQIIKPDRDPFAFDVDREYEFEAVAFIEGTELPGGEVTWDWDFGDETDHSTDNPTHHTYAARGSHTVIVTASYGGMSGQDTLNAKAVAPGTGDLFMGLRLIARGGLGHNFGGTVCDQVEIAVRAPIPAPPDWLPPFTAQFYHNLSAIGGPVGNTGEQEGGTSYSVAICPSVWPSPYSPNGIAHQWRADVTVHVGEPPPFGYDEYWSVTGDFTPDNLVITTGGPLVIVHKQGDEKHTLTWNSHHLESAEAGVSPIYHATVEVYGMSGALVTSSGSLPYTINQAGSWDWYPGFGQGDSDGLYAFRVVATHGILDDDTDKVHMFANVDGLIASLDVPTMTATFTLNYHASGGDVAKAKAVIYNSNLDEVGQVQLGDGGYVPGNTMLTAQAQVSLPPAGPWGTFHVVMTGEQTMEAGVANRDQLAKPVVPRGSATPIVPLAISTSGGDAFLLGLSFNQARAQGQTEQMRADCTPNYGVASWAADDTRWALENCAIFAYYGHANPDTIGDGTGNHPYLSTEDLDTLRVGHVLLALWCGCDTAQDSGDNWLTHSQSKGIDCAIGFKHEVNIGLMPTFSAVFWFDLAEEGIPASAALYGAALQANWPSSSDWTGYGSYDMYGDLQYAPVRFGE